MDLCIYISLFFFLLVIQPSSSVNHRPILHYFRLCFWSSTSCVSIVMDREHRPPSPPHPDVFCPTSVDWTRLLRVAVHGNKGVGKTAVLNALSDMTYEHPGLMILPEPVDNWTSLHLRDDGDNVNVLESAHRNPAKYRFPLQQLIRASYLPLYFMKPHFETVRVMEGSIHAGPLFPPSPLPNPDLVADVPDLATSTPVRVCRQVEHHLEDAYMSEPFFRDDLIIYLRASPETCSRRLEARGRDEDRWLSLEHLRLIHAVHEEHLLVFPSNRFYDNNVLVVDAEPSLHQVVKTIMTLLQRETQGLVDRVFVHPDAPDDAEVVAEQADYISAECLKRLVSEICGKRRTDGFLR